MTRRGAPGRVDPLLAGLVAAAVVAGGGLVAYGSSQASDDPSPRPATVGGRDDDLAARALEAVAEYAGSGEDGTPSERAAARRAAQASLRGLKVDPFRAVPEPDVPADGGAATAGGSAAAGSGAGSAGPADVTASAVRQARRAVAEAAAAAGAAGGSGDDGASTGAANPDDSTRDGGGSGTGGSGDGGSGTGGSGTGGSGDGGSNGDGGSKGDGASHGDGGAGGDDGGGASSGDGDGGSVLRGTTLPDPLTLAALPARLTLRVRTPATIRRRERVRTGTLLPNRRDPVLRIVRVSRSNRVVTLRLRDGARLSGPQSPGTRCVVRELPSGQCRLVHVRVGRAAVVEGAGTDGQPGRITAVRVLGVWRGSFDVTER